MTIKVKHTKNGNVKITLPLDEAEVLLAWLHESTAQFPMVAMPAWYRLMSIARTLEGADVPVGKLGH